MDRFTDPGRKMIDFPTTRALAAHVGLRVDESDPRGENFPAESDWGISRGSGFGLPGSHQSGWLVTFAAEGRSSTSRGYLIAHAIQMPSPDAFDALTDQNDDGPESEQPTFGGRCLLLGGPWSSELDERLLEAAKNQDWFESRVGGAKVNIEMLDHWLQENGRGIN